MKAVREQRRFLQRRRQGWTLLGAVLGFVAGSRVADAELVEVATQSYTQLSDGSLQVTFANGRSVIVPSGDWTFVNGRLFMESTAISQAGTSTATTAQTSVPADASLADINPWTLAAGSVGLGLLMGSDSGGGGEGSDQGIRASGTTLSGKIENEDSEGTLVPTQDDRDTVVIEDISSIFTDATGTITYNIEVRNSSGSVVTDLVYLDKTALKILSDPEVRDNGLYTVTITATDQENGSTAQADVFVEVDVVSEATIKGDMADESKILTQNSGTVVVDDLAQYFDQAEGTFSFSIVVKGAAGDSTVGQLFNDVFSVNGNQLILDSTLTDSFVEGLNNSTTDEVIVLEVVVTATDSADGTKVTQTSFEITLDATVNDAPELKAGSSDTYTIDKDLSNEELSANEDISDGLDLSAYVIDDEGDSLSWSIVGSTKGSYKIENGVFTGTSGSEDETVTISVTDNIEGTTPLTFTINIDIA